MCQAKLLLSGAFEASPGDLVRSREFVEHAFKALGGEEVVEHDMREGLGLSVSGAESVGIGTQVEVELHARAMSFFRS